MCSDQKFYLGAQGGAHKWVNEVKFQTVVSSAPSHFFFGILDLEQIFCILFKHFDKHYLMILM